MAGEGLDLKGVREVHILEPWHHLNKMSQVIGRAIRTCSHKFLPLEKRNCTVYLHVATTFKATKKIKKKEYMYRESLDLRIYRKAEIKSLQIAIVERELKKNAIDCELNKKGNIYLSPEWNQKLKIITSQNKTVEYIVGDKPYSKICNYQKDCKYECNPNIKKIKKIEIDNDTYDFHFAQKHILNIYKIIKELFRKDFVYILSEIVNNVKEKLDISDIIIYKSLDMMIKNKMVIFDKYETKGYLIFKNGYYLFQPFNIKDEKIPLYYRTVPKLYRTSRVPLLNNIYIDEIKQKKDKQKSMVEEKISFDYIKKILNKQVTLSIDGFTNDVYWKDNIKLFKHIEIEKKLDRLSDIHKSFLMNDLIIKYNNIIDQNLDFKKSFDDFSMLLFKFFYDDFLFIKTHLYLNFNIFK